MATVKFTDPDEFLAELQADATAGHIDRNIVRATCRTVRDTSLPLHSLAVVASYVAGGHVVTLWRRCGNTFFAGSPETDATLKAANETRERIAGVARGLGLEVRAGAFEA